MEEKMTINTVGFKQYLDMVVEISFERGIKFAQQTSDISKEDAIKVVQYSAWKAVVDSMTKESTNDSE